MTTQDQGAPSSPKTQRRAGVRLEMKSAPAAASSPTEQVLARANEGFEVIDARGRRIALKRPPILAEYRLVEILGESASNKTYVGMVTPVVWVTAVDGEPIPPPVTKREVEAMIGLLDREGLTAIAQGIKKQYPGEFEQDDTDREAVKG